MVGKETADVDAAPAGDIAVLPKLDDVLTSDTLSAKGDVVIAPLPLPEPLYPVAIVAKTKADEDKLGTALNKLVDEEPTLLLKRDDETHQTVLYGARRHRRSTSRIAKLKDRYNVEAETRRAAHPLPRDDPQDRHGAGPPQEADRRLGPVRRLLAARRAQPRRRLRVRRRDRRRQDPAPVHPRHRQGRPEHHGRGRARRLPDGRREGRRLRRLASTRSTPTRWRSARPRASASGPLPRRPTWSCSSRSRRSTSTCPSQYAGAVMGDMSSRRGRILGMDVGRRHAAHPRAGPVRRGRALLAACCARSRTAPARTRSRSASTPRYPTTWPRRSSSSYQKEKAEGH